MNTGSGPRRARGLTALSVFFLSLLLVVGFFLPLNASALPVPDPSAEWTRLIKETADIGLPSRFLRLLPSTFVKLEFADLKAAAAEYHPEGHRMVFNVALSEGGAGRRFRPLREISNQDLATIYHELFHAYFDYIEAAEGAPTMPTEAARFLAAARHFKECRYTVVDVISGPQRKGPPRRAHAEQRRLSESEGWDALNETWAVFVGWAIWNKLEVTNRLTSRWNWDVFESFRNRLEEAYGNGEFAGYFEPENPEARKVVPRWYLAPSSMITPREIVLLLETIIEDPPALAAMLVSEIASDGNTC